VIVGLPLQVPFVAVTISPSFTVPVTVGIAVFEGGIAAMGPTTLESALPVAPFDAVTRARR
jgi:hypothetical protein